MTTYPTAAEILALPAADPTQKARLDPRDLSDWARSSRSFRAMAEAMVAPMCSIAADFERGRAALVAAAEIPGESDLAWAVMALTDLRGEMFAPEARDQAARWVADEFAGFPGDERARAEVRHLIRRIADSESESLARFRREVLVVAAFEAVAESAADLPAWSDTPIVRKHLANRLLVVARRNLGREGRDLNRHALGLTGLPEQDKTSRVELSPEISSRIEEVGSGTNEMIERALRVATSRQRDVMLAVQDTESLKDAAQLLGLADSTVRVHLLLVRRKMAERA